MARTETRVAETSVENIFSIAGVRGVRGARKRTAGMPLRTLKHDEKRVRKEDGDGVERPCGS